MLRMTGVAIIGVMTATFLKQQKPAIALAISIFAAIMVAVLTILQLDEYKKLFTEFEEVIGENTVYIKVLLKMIGITYVCNFCADICKDSGYQTVSGQVYIFGKCLILFSAIPILQMVVEEIRILFEM